MPHVIEWDGDEPFIRVNDEFRLTPYRDPEDTEGMCEISNFPDVGKWSYMRPYPYTVPDARIWFDLTVPSQKAAVALLKANKEEAADVGEVSPASTPTPPLSVIPFIVLRDKTGKYLGDASLTFEDDVWVIAYALNPSLWGKGVGTQMVKTLIEWGEESNGVKEVHAIIETANIGSTKLAQKLGFQQVGTETRTWPDQKGGGEREVAMWRRGSLS